MVSELSTLHGFQSRGFPNCFFMGLTQGELTVNFTQQHQTDCTSGYYDNEGKPGPGARFTTGQ